jgi:hypothetical protein
MGGNILGIFSEEGGIESGIISPTLIRVKVKFTTAAPSEGTLTDLLTDWNLNELIM